mgnify:CR=1 FL=1
MEEKLHDHKFCDRYTDGLVDLRREVEPYSLSIVAERTGVAKDLIADAARIFAAGPKGVAVTGTGPEMSAHPNLTQHLTASLNTICGRFYRAGDTLACLLYTSDAADE